MGLLAIVLSLLTIWVFAQGMIVAGILAAAFTICCWLVAIDDWEHR
jgi:hypothetical protein